MVTARVPAPADGDADPTRAQFPLLIAVAATSEERVRLAELVDDVGPLLLVSNLDELRRLITPDEASPTSSPVRPAPTSPPMPPAYTGPSAPESVHAAGPSEPAYAAGPGTPDPEYGAAAYAGPVGQTESRDVLTIDSARSVARHREREVPLTDLEHDLLIWLMREPARVWTYEALHEAVWRDRPRRGTADVHSLVKRLRRKLEELGTTITVDAVRGTGFRLADHQQPTGLATTQRTVPRPGATGPGGG